MKNIVLILALFMGFVVAATAQVEVELRLNQEQFLPGEAIPLRVRVVNRSGQDLHFGDENWVTFTVEPKDGSIVEELGGHPVIAHNFDVAPSKMATTKPINIAPFYKIQNSGRYSVTATVHIDSWSKDYTSKPKFFDVIHGNKIWEQTFGVPQPTNSSVEPEVRKYVLQQASLLNRLSLYLKISDESENRVIKVLTIGSMISFSNPQSQTDSRNFLHVLYQEASQKYLHTVINCDGEIILRETYLYSTEAPHFKTNKFGDIAIEGGQKTPSENDIPPALKNIDATPTANP